MKVNHVAVVGVAALLLPVVSCQSVAPTAGTHLPRPRLVLIVVDGLDARDVDSRDTPVLARYWRDAPWCPMAEARAAMPARTNVNHATLATGVHPQIHGITGNAFWDRVNEQPAKLGAAEHLLTETAFTVAHRARPPLRTAAALGKGKLAMMFAGTTSGQQPPERMWEPRQAARGGRDPQTGYAYDRATLRGARAIVENAAVDFLLVNLADVDRVSHGAGPHSPEAGRTRRATDAAVGEFIAFLRGDDGWPLMTVVVTGDHGFDTVHHAALRFARIAEVAGLSGIVSVGDGGVGHVYLRNVAVEAASERLAVARRLALNTTGIAEALYVEPNPADGGDAHTLAGVHPDWHLAHERSGDLLLVAEPGYVFADGAPVEVLLKGNHGGPGDRRVPVIVIRPGKNAEDGLCDDVTTADLGRTVIACLGMRDVEGVGGRTIPVDGRGRLLSGLCS